MTINAYKIFTKILSLILISLFMTTFAFGLDTKQYEKFTENSFILTEYLEILYKQDRNVLLTYFPKVETKYSMIDEHSEDYIEYTWIDLPWFYQIQFWIDKYNNNSKNDFYKLAIGDNVSDIFEIKEMKILENKVVFSVKNLSNDSSVPLIAVPRFILNDFYNISLFFDGDYFDLYIDDVFIHKFCNVNKEIIIQYENLIKSNTCDLSKVTWPRHADGTSEYDNKIIIPQPIVLFEDENIHDQILETAIEQKDEVSALSKYAEPRTVMVKKNNEMVIAENSIIRMNPDSNGTYMTSVVKGAKVKILKIGKKETINNVTSNWVLINFVGDAYNEKGKKIYYKTEGWIFGGYLE